MGCHFLLQGIFLTQGSSTWLLHWQVGSSTTGLPGKLQGGLMKGLNKSDALWQCSHCQHYACWEVHALSLVVPLSCTLSSDLPLEKKELNLGKRYAKYHIELHRRRPLSPCSVWIHRFTFCSSLLIVYVWMKSRARIWWIMGYISAPIQLLAQSTAFTSVHRRPPSSPVPRKMSF